MSSSIVADGPSRLNPASLLSVGDVSDRFNVHPNTVRNHADKGSLRCLRINGKHRRFTEDDVLTWLGLSAERKDEDGDAPSADTVPLAIVARVSTSKQARKSGANADGSSLDHQIDRLESFVYDKWGPEVLKRSRKYYGTGSGLNFERPELLRLVRDVLDGRFKGGYIVAYDQTRIVRFGIQLMNYLCKIGGCEIVYVMKDGEDSEADNMAGDLAEDLLSVVTHFTNKYSGMKAAKITTIPVDDDDLARMWQLHCDGYGCKVIVDILKSEGRRDPKHGKPYTRWVVERSIAKSGEVLEQTLGRTPTRFEQFAAAHVEQTGHEGDLLEYEQIERAYQNWEEGLPVANPVIKAGMLKMGLDQKRLKRGGIRRKFYVGACLV